LITGFFILVTFYLAYRLNRDEGIIVILQERITNLEEIQREMILENEAVKAERKID